MPYWVDIVESSGNADLDSVVRETVTVWRFKPRPAIPAGVSICLRIQFLFKGQGVNVNW